MFHLVVDEAPVPRDHPLFNRQAQGLEVMRLLADRHPEIRLTISRLDVNRKPKIKGLMRVASEGGCAFSGFLNSDVLPGEAFAQSIDRWSPFDAIRVRRTDFHEDGTEERIHTPSSEGIIMKTEVWHRVSHSFPDGFVLGEPGWDTCWILWLHHLGLKVARLDNGEVRHPYHQRTWRAGSQLYRNYGNIRIMNEWLANVYGHNRIPSNIGWTVIDSYETVL